MLMQENYQEIALFPINLSVLPYEKVNLHIFEDRYKKLINHSLDENKNFGIVYTKNKVMSKIGTVVKINEIYKKYDDGRFDLSVKGLERFKILKSYKEHELWKAKIRILDESYEDIDKNYFNLVLDKYLRLILSSKLNNNISQYMNKKTSFDFTKDVILPNSLKQDFLELENEQKRMNYIDIFLDSLLDKKKFPGDNGNFTNEVYN
ncbi:MAG: hypothetical protein CMG39_01615 [Candidatus Marinimicrobia bacterium]|nr:hypothetical protein [Candidatus Neomarinimicrobiota bacterium]|tara:strand:+ start:2417 stop:3034 length:618 start_codon:yes stop_codon:yes gene_type:complete